ncbi:MAG: type IV pilus modification PilV family protein [Opitutales bacterium]
MKSYLSQRSYSLSKGFSLTEVLIAMFVFSMTAVSVVTGLMSTRKSSEQNIYQSSIITVVTGFIEQTKSMSFSELKALADGTNSSIEYIVSNANEVTLTNDTETILQIPIDADDEGNTTVTVDLYIRVKVSDVADYDAVQLDILYGYSAPLSDRYIRSSSSTIISDVPTF